jgi:NAD(P)-dependent dehydrogenase (short-subunit alcohol dehydrogenase family)
VSRVALITGGGRGIGRAIAEVFAADGIAVAVAGRNADTLQDAVATMQAAGGTASAHVCDVASEEAVDGLFAAVLERHGTLDILVNNAAVEGPTAPIAEVSPQEWDDVQAVNVRGAFLCTRLAARVMTPRGSGHVLFLSALGGGVRAYPLRSPYAVSKASVLALMQTAAAELRPHGIGVNAITPGPVNGERLDRVFARRAEQTGTTVEAVAQALADKAPAGRFPDEAELARIALWLCGPDADMIVGQSLNVMGGIDIVQ